MGSLIRVDWAAIKNRWGPSVSEPHLFVLPKGFAQLVLAIQERLIWEATYRVEGYDPADYDEIQDIVGLGLGGLTDSMPITDLLAALQSIEDAIYLTACCDALTGDPLEIQQNTDPVTEGSGDVPANVVASGYATDSTDWAGFRDYKCDAAHVLVDSAIVISNQLAQALDLIDLPLGAIGAIAAIAGIVGAIYATGGLALVFGITGAAGAAATLWSFFAEVGDEAILETSATEFETYRDEIVCAIMNADGHAAAAAAVRAVIDANFTFPTIPKLYFWDSYLAALYDGRWGDTDFAQSVKDSSRFGSTCDCTGEVDVVEFDFTNDAEGWVKPDGTTPANWVAELCGNVGAVSKEQFEPYIESPPIQLVEATGTVRWDTIGRTGHSVGDLVNLFLVNDQGQQVSADYNPTGGATNCVTNNNQLRSATFPAGTYRIRLGGTTSRNAQLPYVKLTVNPS